MTFVCCLPLLILQLLPIADLELHSPDILECGRIVSLPMLWVRVLGNVEDGDSMLIPALRSMLYLLLRLIGH